MLIQDTIQLSTEENLLIQRFHEVCLKHAETQGYDPIDNQYTVEYIASLADIKLYDFHKEGIFIQAIWVTYLSIMNEHIMKDKGNDHFKYPTMNDFHEAYNNIYKGLDIHEQEYLWQTANWMHILFKLITARKNKGLAMQIIPKLVEGWQTKYVTGSGQTKATANRVHIFESEGEITASHRGGRTKHRKPTSHRNRNDNMDENTTKPTKPTKRNRFFDPMSLVNPFECSEEEELIYFNEPSSDDLHLTVSMTESEQRQDARVSKYISIKESPQPTLKKRSASCDVSTGIPMSVYQHPINANKHLSSVSHRRSFGGERDEVDSLANTDADDDSVDDNSKKINHYISTHKISKVPAHIVMGKQQQQQQQQQVDGSMHGHYSNNCCYYHNNVNSSGGCMGGYYCGNYNQNTNAPQSCYYNSNNYSCYNTMDSLQQHPHPHPHQQYHPHQYQQPPMYSNVPYSHCQQQQPQQQLYYQQQVHSNCSYMECTMGNQDPKKRKTDDNNAEIDLFLRTFDTLDNFFSYSAQSQSQSQPESQPTELQTTSLSVNRNGVCESNVGGWTYSAEVFDDLDLLAGL